MAEKVNCLFVLAKWKLLLLYNFKSKSMDTLEVKQAIQTLAAMNLKNSITPAIVANVLEKIRILNDEDFTRLKTKIVEEMQNVNNAVDVLKDKTTFIEKSKGHSDEEVIIIQDNDGEIIAKISEEQSDFKNLKSNGKDVLTEHQDISGLATKVEINGKQDIIPQISQSTENFDEDEQAFSSDDFDETTNSGEVYAKIGSYGIKTKDILDINGNPFFARTNIPKFFEDEIAVTANSIKNIATDSSTVLTIFTDTHERYWESTDVKTYDVSFENIKRVNSIYKSNALVHLGDILMSSDSNSGKYNSQEVVNAHLKAFFDRMRAAHDNSVIVLGNHEDLYAQGAKGGDAKAIYPSIAIYDYSCERYKDRPFFYIDNNADKVRSIFLCAPYQWDGKQDWHFGEEQINWLIDTALNVSDDWHCIFFSHTPLFSNDMVSASDYGTVASIINAFNNHRIYFTSWGKTADFSKKKGTKSVAWVCGHEHCDLVVQPNDKTAFQKNYLSCPIIIIGCHFRYGANGDIPGATYYDTTYRTQENKNKDLWDTLIYRKDQAKIYMIRFGAGEDRVINV